MPTLGTLRRLAVVALGATLWSSCTDRTSDITGPPSLAQVAARKNDIQRAIAAQEKHTPRLMRIPGVVGTAVGLLPNGRAAVRVLLETAGSRGIGDSLDGVPVAFQVTGRFMALSDPTTRQRPAPVGFSVGHPAITAGTIGARVVDGAGNVFVLSNNHVLANSNDASIGDATLQPGPFDGGTSSDQIATLFAFKPIDFSGAGNTFDAAIAISSAANLGNATPTDDGYGTPSSGLWGDANQDGTFDDKTALLGLNVEKYGRTTKLTHGQITGINATIDVCYEVFIFLCVKSAHFVDQLVISPGGFSGGGDSGSLIVSDDGTNSPVALLFAGSGTQTIANRIDLVLNHFGVSVDGGAPPPPPPPPDPMTDIAIASVNAPASVTQGGTVNVGVVVRNAGNQNVGSAFDVTLQDATDGVTIGTQSVGSLAAGASVTLPFPWSTGGSSLGSHTLTASQAFADDNAANDQASANVTVGSPSVVVHIGDLDGIAQRNGGGTWSARVEITVHDADHNPLNGATVVGHWSQLGLNSDTCTTGELGGTGSCIMLFPSLKKSVTFVNLTVVSVTIAGRTYDRTFNHDVDGGSNGTTIRVSRP
jgi:hypothetical protein